MHDTYLLMGQNFVYDFDFMHIAGWYCSIWEPRWAVRWTGPPGIPVWEFPGIRHLKNSRGNFQEFPREFPGITEFSAGICGNFRNLLTWLIFVRNFESSLSWKLKTHCSSFFWTQVANYLILDESNYWSFCPFWCCLLFQLWWTALHYISVS